MSDVVLDEQRLRTLLAAIGDGDDRGTLMTNQLLVKELGWTPTEVATMLADAKESLLIWGLKTGGVPQPHYEELELTVQGSRFLRSGAGTA
jgi:hypothetical protein